MLGLYYLSIMREDEKQKHPRVFGDIDEIEHALHAKAIDLHTKIKFRWYRRGREGRRHAVLVRHHAGPRDARQRAAEEPEDFLRLWSTSS